MFGWCEDSTLTIGEKGESLKMKKTCNIDFSDMLPS